MAFGLTLWPVPTMKKEIEPASAGQSLELPDDFFGNLSASLAMHILPEMGGVRVKKVERFAERLLGLALRVLDLQNRLDLERAAESDVRELRVRCGRAKAAVGHSLKYLRKAESIGKEMIDKDGLCPGVIDFQPAQKKLERLERKIGYFESLNAALIHPSLRKNSEKRLADKMPHGLYHPDVKATPGSSKVIHRTVEMLSDEIEKFTGGKVNAGPINKFICAFLKSVFNWRVDAANVKTIRKRYSDRKLDGPPATGDNKTVSN